MSPYDHPVQKANRARPIVIADGEINPAMWNPKLTIVRQSKVRAAHPYRLRAIVDSIQLSDGVYRRNRGRTRRSGDCIYLGLHIRRKVESRTGGCVGKGY